MRYALAALVAALVLSSPAGAHLSYCGHYRAFNSNATIMERYEGTVSGWGHRHQYTVFQQMPNGSWITVHTHIRRCPAH